MELDFRFMVSVCDALIRGPERFAKTAGGWLLREVSRHDQNFVLDFIRSRTAHFSSENAGNALKYFAVRTRADLLAQVKRAANQSMSSKTRYGVSSMPRLR